jgi:hypothetical protein
MYETINKHLVILSSLLVLGGCGAPDADFDDDINSPDETPFDTFPNSGGAGGIGGSGGEDGFDGEGRSGGEGGFGGEGSFGGSGGEDGFGGEGGFGGGFDTDGDEIPDRDDNCIDVANGDQADFDEDEIGDACDEDDDGDGFPDGDDPDPFDPDNPGDFSSPEAILASPLISDAIMELADLGIDFDPILETAPPELSGRYRREYLAGTALATSNGQDVGQPLVGWEFVVATQEPLLITSEGFGFDGNGNVLYEITTEGVFLRGEDDRYATFGRGAIRCLLGGSDYTLFVVQVGTGLRDPSTGDVVDERSLTVTVATSGVLTNTCRDSFIGDSELTGGWALRGADRIHRIGDL